jgi:hypothetical protein
MLTGSGRSTARTPPRIISSVVKWEPNWKRACLRTVPVHAAHHRDAVGLVKGSQGACIPESCPSCAIHARRKTMAGRAATSAVATGASDERRQFPLSGRDGRCFVTDDDSGPARCGIARALSRPGRVEGSRILPPDQYGLYAGSRPRPWRLPVTPLDGQHGRPSNGGRMRQEKRLLWVAADFDSLCRRSRSPHRWPRPYPFWSPDKSASSLRESRENCLKGWPPPADPSPRLCALNPGNHQPAAAPGGRGQRHHFQQTAPAPLYRRSVVRRRPRRSWETAARQVKRGRQVPPRSLSRRTALLVQRLRMRGERRHFVGIAPTSAVTKTCGRHRQTARI